jgi:phosphoglycerate dehydrogenase-like enzyme
VDYPFFDLPNVIGSPHKADRVPAMRTKAVRAAAENVRDFLEGKPVRGVVDRADYLYSA